MHIKRIHEMEEKLTEIALCEINKGIEQVNTAEMGAVIDMIKDLAGGPGVHVPGAVGPAGDGLPDSPRPAGPALRRAAAGPGGAVRPEAEPGDSGPRLPSGAGGLLRQVRLRPRRRWRPGAGHPPGGAGDSRPGVTHGEPARPVCPKNAGRSPTETWGSSRMLSRGDGLSPAFSSGPAAGRPPPASCT